MVRTHHPQFLFEGFCSAREDYQLSELNLVGGKFTWEKRRGIVSWVREKLDQGFANANLHSKFPIYNLKMLHLPVSVLMGNITITTLHGGIYLGHQTNAP